MSDQRSKLRQHLSSVSPGAITDTDTLIPLLMDAWSEFDGHDQDKMKSHKLDRIEDVTWSPPCVVFTIERHGGTVMGSSRGELQDWVVDITGGTARASAVRFRQLSPRQLPLRVEPLVERVVTAIDGQGDECLDRLPNGLVRVRIGVLIPDAAAKQTVRGRRERFRRALDTRLSVLGWCSVPGRAYYTYARQQGTAA